MTAAPHNHPVDAATADVARDAVLDELDAARLSDLLGLLSDPTRIRVLFALVSVKELCVGDLALVLGISMDQSSYALRQLKGAGLVSPRREGRVIFYRLADGFPHRLLDHCLRQLLTISAKAAR